MSEKIVKYWPFASGFLVAFALMWIGGQDFNERGFWTAYAIGMCMISGALTQAFYEVRRHD